MGWMFALSIEQKTDSTLKEYNPDRNISCFLNKTHECPTADRVTPKLKMYAELAGDSKK
jgi:hypothetical protein